MELNNLNWQDHFILIAEDDEDCYRNIICALKYTNINILLAKNGIEAVNQCTSNKNIDLVLMDISMPLMSGIEATVRIKESRGNLPVIIQSAYCIEDISDELENVSYDGYLRKPYSKQQLISIVSVYLNILSDHILLGKEEILSLSFPNNDVLCDSFDKSLRENELLHAWRLGTNKHRKVLIIFEDSKHIRGVYTVIWRLSDLGVKLKENITIPTKRIRRIIF